MDKEEARTIIKDMLCRQRLAVLATHSMDFPYASLIFFWASENLRSIFFATSKKTRKFMFISASSMVSLLIDDRQEDGNDYSSTSAITAIGEASVTDKKGEPFSKYLHKNPKLEEFLSLSTTAFIKINMVNYFIVTRFNQVYHLPI